VDAVGAGLCALGLGGPVFALIEQPRYGWGEPRVALTTILPGVAIFGLGMSATVAPLTATVLGSVPAANAGIASGVNNAVARVASLLAIAALGAVVSSSFESRLEHDLAASPARAQAAPILARAQTRPLEIKVNGIAAPLRAPVRAAQTDASVHAFGVAMAVAAALAALGGVLALIGIENPRRERGAGRPGGAGRKRRSAARARQSQDRHEPAARAG